jgi:hypothetical protein
MLMEVIIGYLIICLKWLRKTKKTFSLDKNLSSWNSKLQTSQSKSNNPYDATFSGS